MTFLENIIQVNTLACNADYDMAAIDKVKS